MPLFRFFLHRARLPLFAAVSLGLFTYADAEPPKVVATIKPIHSLTAAILEGVAEPVLLLHGASSPHTYALKPSDGKALSEASAVVRVSENLEVFLDRALATLPKNARVVDLEEAPGLALLPIRSGANYESHEDSHEGEGNLTSLPGHRHGTSAKDVHFWLDPEEAVKLSDYLATEFSAIDPEHGAQYKANAERLKSRLTALNEELKAKLLGLRDRPFIVFHDVTQYFERRYGLKSAGAITISPERQPGAKKLETIRSKIERLNAVCVFSEPQFPPKLIDMLVEGTQAKVGTLDEIGVEIPPGPEHYFAFMRKNADNLAECLTAEPGNGPSAGRISAPGQRATAR